MKSRRQEFTLEILPRAAHSCVRDVAVGGFKPGSGGGIDKTSPMRYCRGRLKARQWRRYRQDFTHEVLPRAAQSWSLDEVS